MLVTKVGVFFFAVFWLVAAALFEGCSREKKLPPQEPKTKYNIVLIVTDALRQDVLGCYGGGARTPNIDQLAERGVLFENAYTTSPWTPPPAVSIFTGSYATSYPYSKFQKTIQIHVPDDEVLLAEALRQRGYDTAVKNENVQASLHNCFQGFDALRRSPYVDEVISEARETIVEIVDTRFRGHLPYLHSYHFLHYLLNIPDDRNFFAAQWILDPHEPFRPVREFEKRIVFNKSDLSKPHVQYTARKHIEGELNEAEVKYLKDRYLAEVESVDERVGYVIKILEYKQLLTSTYFVFTSDHGELFGEHDRFGHGRDYYEELIRVPLIIAGPGLPEGTRIGANVSLVDLMPTLKDLLGIDYPDNMQGESFKRFIFDDAGETKPLYFDDVREHVRVDALLEDGFKLIALRDSTCELYDLENDAHELNDVAAVYEDKVQAMLQKILVRRVENKHRQTANLVRLDGEKDELSEEEREELQKKLKALGYIQ
jgi:arylsulfatase A-like enzyme